MYTWFWVLEVFPLLYPILMASVPVVLCALFRSVMLRLTDTIWIWNTTPFTPCVLLFYLQLSAIQCIFFLFVMPQLLHCCYFSVAACRRPDVEVCASIFSWLCKIFIVTSLLQWQAGLKHWLKAMLVLFYVLLLTRHFVYLLFHHIFPRSATSKVPHVVFSWLRAHIVAWHRVHRCAPSMFCRCFFVIDSTQQRFTEPWATKYAHGRFY